MASSLSLGVYLSTRDVALTSPMSPALLSSAVLSCILLCLSWNSLNYILGSTSYGEGSLQTISSRETFSVAGIKRVSIIHLKV